MPLYDVMAWTSLTPVGVCCRPLFRCSAFRYAMKLNCATSQQGRMKEIR